MLSQTPLSVQQNNQHHRKVPLNSSHTSLSDPQSLEPDIYRPGGLTLNEFVTL